jgi:hypothetical protein
MRDYRQIIEIISDLETAFPIESLTYGEIALWPVMRQQIANTLFWDRHAVSYSFHNSVLRSVPGVPARVAHALADSAAAFMSRGKFSASDVLFLTAGFEYVPFQGAFYNRFLDPVKELLDRRGVSYTDVEFGFQGKDFTPKHFPTVDVRRPVGLLSTAARIGSPALSRRERSALARFREYCATNHRLSLDVRNVVQSAQRISSLSRLFSRMLSAAHPKVCIYVCSYQETTMALAHACRRLGIKTMEIQHSVISEYDWNWCKWSAIPDGGYSTMPDLFWSWAERYSTMLDCWQRRPNTNLSPLVGGNLWIGKWLHSTNNPVPEATSRLRASGRTILYTVPFGDVKLISEWFSPEFDEAVRRSPADWTWIIRLHYKADETLLRHVTRHVEQLGPNVHVHHADEHHLYHLLSVTDVHISQTSTTVVEAEAFGVPNLILGEVGRAWYQSEIESGWYGYARTADELLQFVRDPTASRNPGQTGIVTDTSLAEGLLTELELVGGSA